MRTANHVLVLALLAVGAIPACDGGRSPSGGKGAAAAQAGMEASMRITTLDFPLGGAIPRRFTADGADASPALAIQGAPEGTGAFALIVDDPDAPVGTWVHWVVYDLPAGIQGLAGGQPRTADLEGGARQGRNSWGRLGWNGPDPPAGKPHRYYFRLYALGAPLGLEAGATAQRVQSAMKGKVLAEAELMGVYGR
jgi:hypothetical protein